MNNKFYWPYLGENRVITTPFSPQHPALDIYMPIDTILIAPLSGFCFHDHSDGGGNVLWTLNTDNFFGARMVHLNGYLVENGLWVEAGTPVARSGNTGTLTTGPHLHFERWLMQLTPTLDMVPCANSEVDWILWGSAPGWQRVDPGTKILRFGEVPAQIEEGLPEHETAEDIATLTEKLTWWLEEMQRQYETGNIERAQLIRISLIKLGYRISALAKQQ